MPSGFTTALAGAICPDVAILQHTAGTTFGVSRGGLRFVPETEIRNVEFDGKRSKIELLDRYVNSSAMFTGTIIEVSNTIIGQLEPGSASATSGTPTTVTYTPKAASALFTAGNYLANVDMVFTRGDGKTLKIRFAKGLITKYEIQSTDNSETEVSIEIEARLDNTAALSSTDTRPYTFLVIG